MSVANSSLSNSIRNRNVVILQETGNLNMKVTNALYGVIDSCPRRSYK